MLRKRLIALGSALFIGLSLGSPAPAVQPSEMLVDPALETRARELSKNLRCMVCQNQSIDDSNAPLAKDLRLLVRERLKAGDSNTEVIDYVVDRYGEFVLLKPRFGWHTIALWGAPALLLVVGGLGVLMHRRRGRAAVAVGAPLTPAEERKLAELTGALSGEAGAGSPRQSRGQKDA